MRFDRLQNAKTKKKHQNKSRSGYLWEVEIMNLMIKHKKVVLGYTGYMWDISIKSSMWPSKGQDDPTKKLGGTIGQGWPPPKIFSPGGHHRPHHSHHKIGKYQEIALSSGIRHIFSGHIFEKNIFSDFWCEFAHTHNMLMWHPYGTDIAFPP